VNPRFHAVVLPAAARAITDAYVRYFSDIMAFFDDGNYFLAL
jgi:hypothetical protein